MERKTILAKVRKTGKSLKHWCVTELGEDRGRIHLHGIFFGNQAAELVIEKWKYGYVFIGNFVNEKTINYISKYMLKDDLNNREFHPNYQQIDYENLPEDNILRHYKVNLLYFLPNLHLYMNLLLS